MRVIFDLDGTLAIMDHRKHLTKNKNWNAYYLACDRDEPNMPVVEILKALEKAGHFIEIWTGRGVIAQKKTVDWLSKYEIPWIRLNMRPRGDNTPDVELKRKWLGADHKNILCVFEDRKDLADMFRQGGVTCLQVK